MVLPFLEYGMWLVLLISGVPLLISTGVSLLVALLQAATQIQEQSVGFLIKMATLIGIFLLGGGFVAQVLMEYMRWTFESVRYLGG